VNKNKKKKTGRCIYVKTFPRFKVIIVGRLKFSKRPSSSWIYAPAHIYLGAYPSVSSLFLTLRVNKNYYIINFIQVYGKLMYVKRDFHFSFFSVGISSNNTCVNHLKCSQMCRWHFYYKILGGRLQLEC